MLNKKSQTKLKIFSFIFAIIFFSLSISFLVIAPFLTNDTLSIKTSDSLWKVVSVSGAERGLVFWSLDAKDKKTELGWIPSNNNCAGWTDKPLYDRENNLILDNKGKPIILKCETAKCSGQNCYHISLTDAQAVNINDYIKLGNQSFVTVYQNESSVAYTEDDFNVTCILYKNNSIDFVIAPNDIFIDNNNFGAYDYFAKNRTNYLYQCNSTKPFSSIGADRYGILKSSFSNPFFIQNLYTELQTVSSNKEEICNNPSANCSYSLSEDSKMLSINFFADYDEELGYILIDPSFEDTFTTSSILFNSNHTEASSVGARLSATRLLMDFNEAPDGNPDATYGYPNVTRVLDKSSYGINGVIPGIPWSHDYEAGVINGSIKFDGSNDFLRWGNVLSMPNELTISIWINMTAVNANGQAIIGRANNPYQWRLFVNGSRSIQFIVWNASSSSSVVYSNNPITLGKWTHVVGKFNGTDIMIYINGTLASPIVAGKGTLNTVGSMEVEVGVTGYTYTYAFKGMMDEFLAFNRSLTDAEILDLYNNNSIGERILLTDDALQGRVDFDKSRGTKADANTGTLTLYGFTSTGKPIYNATGGYDGSGAYEFDGENSRMGFTSSSLIGTKYSVCSWFKSLGTAPSQIIYSERSFSNANPINGQLYISGSKVYFVSRGDDGGNSASAVGTTTLQNNTWYFACGVRNENNVYVYLNGLQEGTDNDAGGAITVNIYQIGAYYYNPSSVYLAFFNGTIDQVTILPYALTPSEIVCLYNGTGNCGGKNNSDYIYTYPPANIKGSFDSGVFYNSTAQSWSVLLNYNERNSTNGTSTSGGTNLTIQTRTGSTYNTTDPSLVGFFALNNDTTLGENSNTFVDLSGKNNGTCSGTSCPAINLTNGLVAMGGYFDAGDFINVSSAINSNIYTSVGALSAWIKPSVDTSNVMAFFQVGNQTNGYVNGGNLQLYYRYNGKICSDIWIINSRWNFCTTGTVAPTNKWTHVVLNHNGTAPEIYIDGIYAPLTYTISTDKSSWINDFEEVKIVRFGGRFLDGSLSTSFNGFIDEVRIYNRSLSASEILDLYNLGATHITDWSAWSTETPITSGLAPDFTAAQGKFFQFRTFFNSNSTLFTPVLLNYSILTNISETNIYPIFSNPWDNNNSISFFGLSLFNITVENTNGSVWIEINNTNITAQNLSLNIYNVSYSLFSSAGNYAYKWWAYGNGTPNLLNNSDTYYYYVKSTPKVSVLYPTNGSYINSTTINLNISVTDTLSNTCIFSLDNFATNESMTNVSNVWNGTASVSEGIVNVVFSCNNTDGIFNLSEGVSFYSDISNPNATLNPANNTYTNTSQNFTANITDNIGISNATLYVYNSSNTLVNSTIFTFVEGTINAVVGSVIELIDGFYTWFYQIFDFAGNQYTTENNTITIDTVPFTFNSASAENSFAVSQFIKVNGTSFTLSGNNYTLIGADSYYLSDYATNHTYDDNGNEINNSMVYVQEILDKAQSLNINVIRTWGNMMGGGCEEYQGCWIVNNSGGHHNLFEVNVPGNYSEEMFKAMDFVIYESSKRDIRLQIVLINNWDAYGGMRWYVMQSPTTNKTYANVTSDDYPDYYWSQFKDQFYTDANTKQYYKNFINYTLNRVNTYSNLTYKDDPAIFAWLLANEPRAKSDGVNRDKIRNWTIEMANYTKSIDTNHLVGLGIEGFGYVETWGEGTDMIADHNGTEVDFATFELHPNQWDYLAQRSENATDGAWVTGGITSNVTLDWWTTGKNYSYNNRYAGSYIPAYIPALPRHNYENWVTQNVKWANSLNMPVLLQELALPTNTSILTDAQKARFFDNAISNFYSNGGDGVMMWNLNHDNYYYSTTPDGIMDDGYSFYYTTDPTLKAKSQGVIDAFSFAKTNNTGGTSWVTLLNNDFYTFNYNITLNEDLMMNCSLWLNSTNESMYSTEYYQDQLNSSAIIDGVNYFTKQFTTDNIFSYWYVQCCNNFLCQNTAEGYISTPPLVDLTSPETGTIFNTTFINFNYTVMSGITVTSCDLYLNGQLNQTDENITGTVAHEIFNVTVSTIPNLYNWQVRCTDMAGSTRYSTQRNFIYDDGIINITLLLPTNGSIVNTQQNYTANITSSAPIGTINLFINGIINHIENIIGTIYSTVYGFIASLSDGVYQWFYEVIDIYGLNNTSSNYTITIDTISPPLSITSPTNGTWFNYYTSVNYTISDIHLDSCWWTNSSGEYNYSLTCGNNISGNWKEGLTNVFIYSNDTAGNTNSSLISFYTDLTPPNATLISPADNLLINIDQNLTANATDNLGLKNATLFVYNSSGLVNKTDFSISGLNKMIGNEYNLSDGVYNWSFLIYDLASNSYVTENRSLEIDKTLPVLTFLSLTPNPAEYGRDNVSFSWSATDLHLDTAYFNLTNSSGYPIITGNTTMDVVLSESIFPVPDTYNFVLFANDTAGNADSATSGLYVLYIVDTTPPEITIEYPSEGIYYNNYNWYINITTDSVANCTINNSNWNNKSGNSTSIQWLSLNLSDGYYTVNISCSDIFDNENSEILSWYVDTHAPNATLTIENNTYTNTQQNYTANITDNIGLKNATLYIYNSSNTLVNQTVFTSISGSLQSMVGMVVTLIDDVYHWFYQVFDLAGNSYTTINNTLTIDTTDPVVTIVSLTPNPAEFSVDTILFNWTATDLHLDYSYFNITSSSGTIVVANNVTRNLTFLPSTFPIPDTYTISVWANDTAGNDAISPAYLGVLTVLDSIPPEVSIITPTAGEYAGSTVSIPLNFTAYDVSNISSAWWSQNGVNNHTINITNNVSYASSATWEQEGGTSVTYPFKLCVNDTYNNVNCTSISIIATVTLAVGDSPSPGSGGSSLPDLLSNNSIDYQKINKSDFIAPEEPVVITKTKNMWRRFYDWAVYKLSPNNHKLGVFFFWAIFGVSLTGIAGYFYLKRRYEIKWTLGG